MKTLALLSVLIFAACKSEAPIEPSEAVEPAAVVKTTAKVVGPLPGDSVYQLESLWTTQNNTTMDLKSLRGKPVIMTMFFGSCRTACPTIIADMQRAEKTMSEELRKDVKFVLITFDHKVDTPDVLKGLEEKFGLDGERWVFLHGNPSSIREIGAVLGVQYREISEGQFSHTNLITLLNEDGVIVQKTEGLRQDMAPLVKVLESLDGV